MKLVYIQAIFICFLAFCVSQLKGQDQSTNIPETPSSNQQPHDGAGDIPDNGEFDPAVAQAQKVMLWGCYFLTKNVLFKSVHELNDFLANNPDQDLLYRKIVSDLMVDCVTNANPADMKELINTYGQDNFSAERWSHLHTFSIAKYKDNFVASAVSEDELVPFDYFNEIDQIVRSHFDENNGVDGKGDSSRQRRQHEEVSFLGYPLQDISYYMKIVFVISLIYLIGSIVQGYLAKRKAMKEVVAAIPNAKGDAQKKEKKEETNKETKKESKKAKKE